MSLRCINRPSVLPFRYVPRFPSLSASARCTTLPRCTPPSTTFSWPALSPHGPSSGTASLLQSFSSPFNLFDLPSPEHINWFPRNQLLVVSTTVTLTTPCRTTGPPSLISHCRPLIILFFVFVFSCLLFFVCVALRLFFLINETLIAATWEKRQCCHSYATQFILFAHPKTLVCQD